MSKNSTRVIGGWVLVLAGALVTLLVAWAAKVVRVPAVTLVTIAAVAVALTWLIVLVTVPWNLYFAARRAAQEMEVSRDRGIAVRPAYNAEATWPAFPVRDHVPACHRLLPSRALADKGLHARERASTR